MDMCHIITIVNGMVENVETFTGADLLDTDLIESQFLDEVACRISNFDEYTTADKEAICENGYERFGNGSVQIHWSI